MGERGCIRREVSLMRRLVTLKEGAHPKEKPRGGKKSSRKKEEKDEKIGAQKRPTKKKKNKSIHETSPCTRGRQ